MKRVFAAVVLLTCTAFGAAYAQQEIVQPGAPYLATKGTGTCAEIRPLITRYVNGKSSSGDNADTVHLRGWLDGFASSRAVQLSDLGIKSAIKSEAEDPVYALTSVHQYCAEHPKDDPLTVAGWYAKKITVCQDSRYCENRE